VKVISKTVAFQKNILSFTHNFHPAVFYIIIDHWSE